MQSILTCGLKPTQFSYTGTVQNGVTILFNTGAKCTFSKQTIDEVLKNFRGKIVPGGFSMTKPTAGGLGHYLQSLRQGYTPRHASFLCAILANEGYVTTHLFGQAVIITFP